MALDPRIILAGEQAQIERPNAVLLRGELLANARQRNEMGAQEMAEKARLNQLLSAGAGEDELIRQGFPGVATTVGNNRRANERSVIDREKADQDTFSFKLGRSIANLATIEDPSQVAEWYNDQVRQGLMPMRKATEQMRAVPLDAAGFAQWKDKMYGMGLSAVERFRLAEQKRTNDAMGAHRDRTAGETERHNREQERIAAARAARAGESAAGEGWQRIDGYDPETGEPAFEWTQTRGLPRGQPPTTKLVPKPRREPEDLQAGAEYSREFGNDPNLRRPDAPGPAEYASAAKRFAKDPAVAGAVRGKWVPGKGFEVKRDGKLIGYYD